VKFTRLKFVLLILLLASNLVVGVLSLFFLRSLNERYASLVDRSVPLLNDLRRLTKEVSMAQRSTLRAIVAPTPGERTEMIARLRKGMADAEISMDEIEHEADLIVNTPQLNRLLEMHRQYFDLVHQFLDLISSGNLAGADSFNRTQLRPAYESYMSAVEGAANQVERLGTDLSQRYTAEAKSYRSYLLAFAGWPLVLAVSAVTITLLLLGVLLFAIFTPSLPWRRSWDGLDNP
jgi:hypothetical protein